MPRPTWSWRTCVGPTCTPENVEETEDVRATVPDISTSVRMQESNIRLAEARMRAEITSRGLDRPSQYIDYSTSWNTIRAEAPELLETIAPDKLALLYRLSVTNDECMMTGSVVMGVQEEGKSDIDFLITNELLISSGLGGEDDGIRSNQYGSGSRSIKYLNAKGVEINLIVVNSTLFEGWKFATNMCIALANINRDMLRDKGTRVALFRTFRDHKINEIQREQMEDNSIGYVRYDNTVEVPF